MFELKSPLRPAARVVEWLRLPRVAKRAAVADRLSRRDDPGIGPTVTAATQWLCRAQDCSASADGGVARDFSLLRGWATSYPETTGYIVPTLLDRAALAGEPALDDRVRRMLDWLVDIQMDNGAFQGGRVDSMPRVPVVFNTGQILMGLASGAREYGEPYLASMHSAAEWLVEMQDPDGCWRRGASPFAMPGEKTYETHVAWGLLEAYRTESRESYLEAAVANVRWALGHQHANGWLANCCLTDPERPLTHTLGYALRGIVEAYLETGDESILLGARRLADGLADVLRPDGFLPGRLRADWTPATRWACLTGTVQIAACWLLMYGVTSDTRYKEAAQTANRFVRGTVNVSGADADTRGGVKGSHPIDGGYARFEYPNWAAKFLIDALVLESEIDEAREGVSNAPTAA